MSIDSPQVRPGGFISSINDDIDDDINKLNETINCDNITNLEAANILVHFAEQLESDESFKKKLTQLKINDLTNKEIKNIIKKGHYTMDGRTLPVSPKINILSHITLQNKMEVDHHKSISWAEEMDNLNKSYYDPSNKIIKDDNKVYNSVSIAETPNILSSTSNFSTINQNQVNNPINFKYDIYDTGPYSVMLESEAGSLSCQKVGKLFCNNPNFGVNKVSRRGRNRVAIFFDNFKRANSFIEDTKFLETNKFKAFIPHNLISCKGLIRNIDINFSEEEILNNIKPIGSNRTIINIRRIKKKIHPQMVKLHT